MLDKAEVNIKPFKKTKFYIADFTITIILNISLIIKKDWNKLQHELSNLGKCQRYSVDIALELKATISKRKCGHDWRMRTGVIAFQILELNIYDISCSHNST